MLQEVGPSDEGGAWSGTRLPWKWGTAERLVGGASWLWAGLRGARQRSGLEDGVLVLFMPLSSVRLLSRVQFFATPWTATHQASLSITNSRSLHKLISINLVIATNHLTLLSPSPPVFNLSQHQGLLK